MLSLNVAASSAFTAGFTIRAPMHIRMSAGPDDLSDSIGTSYTTARKTGPDEDLKGLTDTDSPTPRGNSELPIIEVPPPPLEMAKAMPGISGPLDFFDPAGFCSAENVSEGKIRFYREVELKHGRVAMLASLGFIVGEQFHPFFGGNIDVPSYVAFQQTPLQTFFPGVLLSIAILEIYSVFTFENPAGGEPWAIRADHEAGDLGFDPLGLKPTDPTELAEMQTKELNNGRLAMIGIAGMVGQELATGAKLF